MTDAAFDPRPQPTDSPAEAPGALRPVVASRPSNNSLWLAVGAAVVLGLIVFLVLLSRRGGPETPQGALTAGSEETLTGTAAASPPPPDLTLVQPAVVAPDLLPGGVINPPPLTVSQPSYYVPPPPPAPGGTPTTAAPSAAQRRAAPTLIVDLSAPLTAAEQAAAAASSAPGQAGVAGAPGGVTGLSATAGDTPAAALAAAVAAGADPEDAAEALSGLNGDEQFAARLSGSGQPERVRATRLRNPAFTVPQGALIPGVLETALNSDLPGYARAVVSRDVRSFDGSSVLIPRGSRVIGQYKSGLAEGQSRALIIWERIIRPDGGSIQIASSGTDALGRAGLDGKVDRKFLQRFGGAILTSVLSAGVAAVSQQPTTSIQIGGQGGGGNLPGAVGPSAISPTIRVPQGSPIRIFVAKDLDFSPVGAAR